MRGKWWQEAVIYQIYPRSFCDSNNDGIGDIQGIIAKLDYLKKLGITAIWVCPFYKSPMDDNGYDVSDFFSIAPEYGTMDDVIQLINELHKREMRLIVDTVLNHTSDEHPWFVESKSAIDNPYRDYYIWKEARPDGSLPSNWESFFGGSVWQHDAQTNSYYMHIFSKRMPDLNWSNELMRKDIYQMMEWWLDKGVDGFRIDAVAHLDRNMDFPNHQVPNGRDYSPCYFEYSNRPNVHEYIQEMRNVVLTQYDVMTVGEAGGASIEDSLKYCAYGRNEFNLLINFDHCWVDTDDHSASYVPGKWTYKKLELPLLKKSFAKYQVNMYQKAWNTIYWSNHDQPRVISHYGNDHLQFHNISAKMLATTLYMMGGTPIIFQGEEIGMTNVAYESLEDYRDVEIYTLYKETVQRGLATNEDIMDRIHKRSRDNARTPMQWDHTVNGGFSTVEPWIKTNPNYVNINVLDNLVNENSIFYYYQKLICIRQNSECLLYGDFKLYLEDDENIFMYTRSFKEDRYLVITNFFDKIVDVEIPNEINCENAEVIISNYQLKQLKRSISLLPYEAIVYHF
ncbi:MAG: glucohydrolase [Haloplasmataceae bacterium]|jgi:oligo-1,6-glucosidase|nr:glucohydrolase [Haloplasmataceae bacterium]